MAVAALVAALLLAAACTGGSGDGDGSPTTPPPTRVTSTTEPPLVGLPLVVAEQGVTTFPDPYDRSQSLGGYGVVLQNPNPDLLAAGVHVTTRLLDAAGTELLVDNALLNGVMPGQRMAVGRTLIEPIASPTQLAVTVEVSAWLRPAAPAGTLSAQEAVTEPEPFGGAVTRFAVQSGWPTLEEGVDVTAIYRAADGRLLAAESTTLEQLPPGSVVISQIRLLSPIPGLASTEVLVGRGFAAQTVG
jgi:hypothetical protein